MNKKSRRKTRYLYLKCECLPSLWSISNLQSTLSVKIPNLTPSLFTLPEHLSSPPVFIGVRVTRSLVLYVCFVDHCLSFCTFSFGHCVVCSSSIYGFWLPLWYLQALFTEMHVQSQECNVIVSIDFVSFYGFSSPSWNIQCCVFCFWSYY